MKRSSAIIIVVLLVLVGFSIYVYTSKNSMTTSDEDDRKFSYKDTAAITKIFIADKEGNSSSVERTREGWIVNKKYKCRTDAILNLLEAIRNVEVKMPVPKEARENVIKFMASGALKVEIYKGDELVKQYYVGHETPDSEGSYMLLTDHESGKNYRNPYACFIPGFIGYLQPRFIAKETEWRDRVVLNYIPPQIKSIDVQYPLAPVDSSFTIELLSTTVFRLKDGKGAELRFDKENLKQYLIYFQNISYEGLITGRNRKLEDSLSKQMPFCILTVNTTAFSKDVFKMYRKTVRPDVNPDLGVKYDYDPDRFYLRFSNDKEWAIAQYFVFGKLFVNPSYFMGVPVKK
jgi:hypothetical protein